MSPQYVSDPAFLSRFEREARLAASLGHSGVVAVYDQGRDGDLVFLVMELVDGGTLRDLLRESGSLSVPVTMSILEPLLAALGAAHAAGLVHRDVKPENVLISAQGAVKIADFGLVRAVSSQTMATGDVILGTVAYLSPEQVATGAADARSDVYAAGVMAYEMLTGEPPFAGDTPMSVAYQHVHSDVPRPAATRASGTPDALDDLIVRRNQAGPGARPRDASAFLAALVGDPLPTGPAAGAGAGPASSAQRRFRRPRGRSIAAPVARGGTRVTAAGPVTVGRPAAGDRPSRQPSAQPDTASATTDIAPAPVQVAHRRAAPAEAAALADRDPGGAAAGVAAAAGGWWLGGRWAATPAAVGLSQAAGRGSWSGTPAWCRGSPSSITTTSRPARSPSTDPAAGTEQLRGSEVDLLVSSGRPEVPAIAARHRPTAAATAALTAADLTAVVGTEPAFDDMVPAGAVLRTDPGRPARCCRWRAGHRWCCPPDRSRSRFRTSPESPPRTPKKLVAAGFPSAQHGATFDPDAEPGTVLGSTPVAGTHGAAGQRGVAAGRRCARPSRMCAASPRKDARKALEKAGFIVTVGDPAFDSGYRPRRHPAHRPWSWHKGGPE